MIVALFLVFTSSACALPMLFEDMSAGPNGWASIEPSQTHLAVGQEVRFIVQKEKGLTRFSYSIEPKKAAPAFNVARDGDVITVKYVDLMTVVNKARLVVTWACHVDWTKTCRNSSDIFFLN